MIVGKVPSSLYRDNHFGPIGNYDFFMGQDQNVAEQNMQWRKIEQEGQELGNLQVYRENNVTISGAEVIIHSTKNSQGNLYSSGMVESEAAYRYGHFAFRVRCKEGNGLISSISLCSDKDQDYPKIDIFRQVGNEFQKIYGITHFINRGWYARDFFVWKVEKKEYHDIAFDWNEDYLAWYIDDKKVYQTTKGVPDEYMYIQIKQAVGSNWSCGPDQSTSFPCDFAVEVVSCQPLEWRLRFE